MGIIDEAQSERLLQGVIERLRGAGYDGSLLKANDLLIAQDKNGEIKKDHAGEPDVIICKFDIIWKLSGPG